MTMWLITEGFSGGFEVQVIWIVAGVGAVPWERVPFPTLEDARGVIPTGAERIPRDSDDHPRVVETWRKA